MSAADRTAPDYDFRRAVRSRYLHAMVGSRSIVVLIFAILANVTLHYWAFDIISERFEWYRSMTAIILGLSVDFYLLCLVSLTHSMFDSYVTNGIFRDLRTAGVRAWDVFQPLFQVLALLIVADTVIEGLLGAFLNHEPAGLAAMGYLLTLGYAVVAAAFIATILLIMNLLRWPLLLQFALTLGISFLALLSVSAMAELWQPALRRWNPERSASSFLKFFADLAGASWNNFSDNYAYYAALMVQASILAVLILPLYRFARRIAIRRFPVL